MKKIDELPFGPEFRRETFTITGDILDKDGHRMTEEAVLWTRDPLECIRDLFRNPTFKDCTTYAPCRVYLDDMQEVRVYSELYTCDWWWDLQVSGDPSIGKAVR